MNLFIVESPAKAKTIKKFLPPNFTVLATFGHIRDLPKKELGVDIENGFKPQYSLIKGRKKIISQIKNLSKESQSIYLACDFDREGEAIAWHVKEACNLSDEKIKRVTFVEITEQAITESLKNPRLIDLNLVNAQQARRILDRLVGYKLSPFLWEKIKGGLSAGRVQSVALRLIVEREREIEAFIPEEFWEIFVVFEKNGEKISSKLFLKNGREIKIKNEKESQKIKEEISSLKDFFVKKIEEKEEPLYPLPPFNTASLQQEAFTRLGFSSKKTMFLSQQLYEGIDLGNKKREGLITYMRTDSFNLSQLALNSIRKYIKENLGEEYLPQKAIFYKTKTLKAQEAHEAIRPTFPQRTPESIKKYLTEDQYKLYDLIWRRTIACQMKPAVFQIRDIQFEGGEFVFHSQHRKLIFEGFAKIYPIKNKENIIPDLKEGDKVILSDIKTYQKFTSPPSRYTEASLVKVLEEKGIGRPSTYATIISTIQERGYVKKEGKYFKPLAIGFAVNDILVKNFPKIIDIKFTAQMEENLDKIAEGKINWQKVLEDFYKPFSRTLEKKYQLVGKIDLTQKTQESCPDCGGNLILREGRYGTFLACENFPNCHFTKSNSENIDVHCPICGGRIVKRKTKKGKFFYGCENYPKCNWASWEEPTNYKCSKCGGLMTQKGKILKCLSCGSREILNII